MHASETTINKTHSIPSQLLREQTCEMLRSFSPTISWTEKKKKNSQIRGKACFSWSDKMAKNYKTCIDS